MADGTTPATPATLSETLNQLEAAINRAELGNALGLLQQAKYLAALGPCPDCGSTHEGHATPCGLRFPAHIHDALVLLDEADSLVVVTSKALAEQSCDLDADCSTCLDVAWEKIVGARKVVESINELLENVGARLGCVAREPTDAKN